MNRGFPFCVGVIGKRIPRAIKGYIYNNYASTFFTITLIFTSFSIFHYLIPCPKTINLKKHQLVLLHFAQKKNLKYFGNKFITRFPPVHTKGKKNKEINIHGLFCLIYVRKY